MKHFFTDKFTDALFIFIGIFAAFYFDQYQENQALKKELNFNLTEIMADFSGEEPKKEFPPFKLIAKKTKEGGCTINPTSNGRSRSSNYGSTYLTAIKERGLVRFANDKRLIRALTTYYEYFYPKVKEAQDKYMTAFMNYVEKIIAEKRDNGTCPSEKELAIASKEIGRHYQSLLLSDGMAQSFAMIIHERLVKVGISRPQMKKGPKVFYSFSFTDDKKLKSSDEREPGITFDLGPNSKVPETKVPEKPKDLLKKPVQQKTEIDENKVPQDPKIT